MSDPVEQLGAGPLVAVLDGADVTDLSWGACAVARRLQVTVRDGDWGTTPPLLRAASTRRGDGFIHAEIEATHDDGGVAFTWRGALSLTADGTTMLEIDGVAERSFLFRRIGICIVHPWRTYVGAGYEATTLEGAVAGTFPEAIAPQVRRGDRYLPMIEAFSRLSVQLPGGVAVDLRCEGDLFELEDQRNWTDASFKTYPTPLARSEPRTIRAGDRISQRITLRSSGPAPAPEESSDRGPVVVRVGTATGRPVPPVGMTVPAPAQIAPAHVRVVLDADAPDQTDLVRAGDVPLEVQLLTDGGEEDLEWLRQALRGRAVDRVLVHRKDQRTTPAEVVRAVGERLAATERGIELAGGTSTFFSELNRNPPTPTPGQAVAFAISPQVHGSDERDMLESLAIQALLCRQVRHLGADRIVVSPVTLTGYEGTRFADAWTFGSLAALLAGGVASITCDAAPAVVDLLARRRGADLLDVSVSDPRRLAALGVRRNDAVELRVANLVADMQPFVVDDREQPALGPYEVRAV